MIDIIEFLLHCNKNILEKINETTLMIKQFFPLTT